MASLDYGLNLELGGYDRFIEQAKNIDKTFKDLATTVQTAADKLASTTFGNLKLDLGGLKDVNANDINAKTTAISGFAKALTELAPAIKKVDSAALTAMGKALSGGAQAKTITDKANALREFASAASKFDAIPNLGTKARQIESLLTVLSAASSAKLGSFENFASIAKDIDAIAAAFGKLGKVKLDPSSVTNIQSLNNVLLAMTSGSAPQFVALVPKIAEAFTLLAKAFRSFSSGQGAANLPAVLTAVTGSIKTLLSELSNLNRSSGILASFGKQSGADVAIKQISALAGAFRDLGMATKSFAGLSGGGGLSNLASDVGNVVKAFQQLASAFKSQQFGAALESSVKPAIEMLSALGTAFTNLGRRKGFTEFPQTIQNINQAIAGLNVQALQELSVKIRAAVPALQQLAEVATAVNKVNTQAAISFQRVANAKTEDTAANRQLLASTLQLAASLFNLLPSLRNLVPLFGSVLVGVKNLASAFISIQFTVINAGFNALRAIFVSFPLKVMETGVRAVAGAFSLLGTVLNAPLNLLRAIGTYARNFERDFKLMEKGLNTILLPFRLLQSILSTIGSAIGAVTSAFSRLVSAISPFSKAASDSARALKETHSAGGQVATALQGTGKAAAESAGRMQQYNTEVQNTSRFSRLAVGGLQLFAGALVAKGVTVAVTRLVNMQIAMRTLDVLSRAAATGFQFLSRAMTGLVGEAFNAAAEFQSLGRSISILMGREQMQMNPGMFKDVLEAASTVKDEADEVLKRFQLLAIQSPFQTKDIADGFRLAQVFGFTSKEAEKMTNVITDVAAGMNLGGYAIADLILPLGQIKQTGKVLTQDLRQLATRGIPVYQILAKEFGVTEGELQNMITNGLLPANEQFSASDRAVNAIVESLGTDFKNAAVSATGSFAGLKNAALELKEATLRDFFTPIFEAILFGQKAGDFALADLLSLDNIQNSIDIAKQYGAAVSINVGNAFQKVVLYVKAFFAVISAIPQPILNTIATVAKFSAVVLGITIGLGALNAIIIGLTATFFVFVNPISLVVGVLISLGLAVSKNFGLIGDAVKDLAISFGQIPQFIQAVQTAFTTFFATGEASSDAFDGLSSTLQFVGKTMISMVSIAKQFGTGLLVAFETLANTGQASTEAFSALPGALRFIATEVFNTINIFAGFASTVLNLPATIGGVVTTVGSLFQRMLGEFVSWGANIITSFADGISGTVDLIAQALQAVGGILTFWLAPGSPPRIAPNLDEWGASAALEFVNNFVKSFIGTLGEGFVAIGAATLTFVAGTFANAFGSAVIVLSGVFQAISSILLGIGNQVYLTVVAIIQSISVLADGTKTATEKTQGVLNIFGFFIRDTFNNIVGVISGVGQGIFIALSGIATFIAGEFVVAFLSIGRIVPVFEDAANAIINFASSADSNIRSFGDGIVDYVYDIFVNVTDYGYGLVDSFATGIISAVSVVADALSAIGNEIAYWLAPGSPPRLLPDIDKWGTSAAGEFIDGFTEADLDTISDFGDGVKKILENTGVEDVDVKKIVEKFSQGLADAGDTGDFGANNLAQIESIAGDAGGEIVRLAEKYAELNKEQRVLNEVTKRYDAELEAANASLEQLTNTQGVELNQQKVEALQKAMQNTLLTDAEKQRIATEIQKLQAKQKIAQLESERKAQEKNVSSVEEAIRLQEKQLGLADKFDPSQTTGGVGFEGATSSLASGIDKAAKAQERLTAAQLKYQLGATDTAGKIEILRGELSKMDEGSLEYVQTLTQIQKLEQQLERERETAAKQAEAASKRLSSAAEAESKRAAAAAEKVRKAELDYQLSITDTQGKLELMRAELARTEEGSAEYYATLKKIGELEKKLAKEGGAGALSGGDLFAGITTGAAEAQTSISTTVDNASKKVAELKTNVTTQFNAIRDTINNAVNTVKGYIDTWIVKNDLVRGSLVAIGIVIAGAKIMGGIAAIGASIALLANPVTAIGAAVIGLVAAFGFFAAQSGGIQGALDSLTEKFRLFKDAFSFGATVGGDFAIDTSSIDNLAVSLGAKLGSLYSNLNTSITTFFTNVGTSFSDGWTNFKTNLGARFSNFSEGEASLSTASETVKASVLAGFFQPIIDAFKGTDTVLGGITAALLAFYGSVGTIVAETISGLFDTEIDIKTAVNTFFSGSEIASAFEANVNEAIGVIVPMLEGKFDLSSVIGTIIQGIASAFEGLMTIKDTIGTAFTAIGDAYNSFVGLFTGAEEGGILSNIIEQNKEAFAEFFREISSPEFQSGLANIALALGLVAGAIGAVAAIIIDVALIAVLKNIGDLVIEVGAGIGTLREAFELFASGDILGGFGKAFEGVGQILDGIFGNIADVIADATKALLEFFGFDTSGTLGVVIDTISDIVVAFFSFRGAATLATSAWTYLTGIFKSSGSALTFVQKIFSSLPTILLIVSAAVNGVYNNIKSFATYIDTTFRDAVGKIGTEILAAMSTPFQTVKDNFATFDESIKTEITAIQTAITTAVTGFGEGVETSFTGFLDSVKTFAINIVTAIGDGLLGIGTKIINWITDDLTSLPAKGLTLAFNFVSGFVSGLGPGIILAGQGIAANLGLVDLTGVASALGTAFMGAFGIDGDEVITDLQTKFKTTLTDALDGVTDIAFELADKLVINETEEKMIAEKINDFLPDFDTIFGAGTTAKVALNLADFITINEEEATFIKDTFDGIVTVLAKFGTLLGIPEAFTTSIQAIKDLFSGDATFSEAITTIWTAISGIVTTLLTEITNPFTAVAETLTNLSTPIGTVSEAFTNIKTAIQEMLTIDLSGFANVFAPVTNALDGFQEKVQGLIAGINLIPGVNIGGAEITGTEQIQANIKAKVAESNTPLSLSQKLDIAIDDDNLAQQSTKLLEAFKASYAENSGLMGPDMAAINKDLIDQGFTAADITALATEFGKEVPAGLAEGMKDEGGLLDRRSRSLATNLLLEIASALDIQSPSGKAKDEIGIPFIQGIAEGLKDTTELVTLVSETATLMFSTVEQILNENANRINIAAALFTLNETSVQITTDAMAEILAQTTNTFDEIGEKSMPSFMEIMEESFDDMWETILDLSEDFSEEFIAILRRMSATAVQTLKALISSLTGLKSDFEDAGQTLGEALMDGIISGIEDGLDGVLGAINELLGEDGLGASSIVDKATEAGEKIGTAFGLGIADGIIAPEVVNAIADAAIAIVKEATEQVENAAGIESPSTLFRDRVGKNITAGIALGMVEGVDDLLTSARFVVSTLYTVARDDVGATFVQGITQGIRGEQEALNLTITSLLNNSVTTAKTALDIHSPSKVTENMIGVPYVDGIRVALESGRDRLTGVASSLLSVLPDGKAFNYSVNGVVNEQPIELKYSNMLTSLPTLSQNVKLQQQNMMRQAYMANSVQAMSAPYQMMKNSMAQHISTMNDSRRSTVSTHNVYNYEMHVQTTPERTERVAKNFEAMRMSRRI